LHSHHHLHILLLHRRHLTISKSRVRWHAAWKGAHLHIAPLGMLRYLSLCHLAIWSGSVRLRSCIGARSLRSTWCPPLHLSWHIVHHSHLIAHWSKTSIHVLAAHKVVRHVRWLLIHSWLSESAEIHHVRRELWLLRIVVLGKHRRLPHHSVRSWHDILSLHVREIVRT
jgi:hypothetical protein